MLYTPAEERFDRITRIAVRLLGVPIALVSLVSEERQWFKSAVGLAEDSVRRDDSFCAHTVARAESFVVGDLSRDERFRDDPWVTGESNLRFYAGEPVRSAGRCIGTLCVLDTRPRTFDDGDRALLKDLAALVEAEFERGQLSVAQGMLISERDELGLRASVDSLTRAWNRGAIMDLLAKEIALTSDVAALTVAMIDVDNFKRINDRFGHAAGDRVLVEVTSRLRAAVRETDSVGRYGGDEFVAVLAGCGPAHAAASAARLLHGVSAEPIAIANGSVEVTVSIGYASIDLRKRPAEELLAAADDALYRAKVAGRNRALRAA